MLSRGPSLNQAYNLKLEHILQLADEPVSFDLDMTYLQADWNKALRPKTYQTLICIKYCIIDRVISDHCKQ